ncbi:hypothetical protein GIB67_038898 [Kingdonia uniflora]|uniref:H(+)-exporting diphosphatase n=1 Tax=Kingdonia uniflora TaxID=39325 RepID=A0A7J7N701_9MAGN|nr:hypothetical protein GIB67_038898 [Kingdonia uniflora]
MSFHNTSIRVSRPEKSSMSSLISMANMSNKTLKSWDSSGDNGYSSNKKRLKINPDSSLIEMLRKQVKNNKNVNDQISLLFETTTPVLRVSVQSSSQPCTFSKDKMCKSTLENVAFSTVALLGAITSVFFFGFLGMKITIYANARTTLEARKGVGKAFITAFRYVTFSFLGMKIATYANARTTLEARKGVRKAFITAFRSGAVMGFLIAANGLLVLYITINVFKLYYGDDWEGLFEAITGYVRWIFHDTFWKSGGIYTKAADVGADLVGKIERNIPEATLGATTAAPILNLSRASSIIMLLAYASHLFF